MKQVGKIGILVMLLLTVLAGIAFTAGVKEAPKQEQFRVAMLLPGPITDQGWNQSAHAGLMQIRDELGAEVDFVEMVTSADMEELFRGYAVQGYNVIYGHGFQFGEPSSKVAPLFPNTKFVITSTTFTQEPNIASILNDSWQQGFLGGALAALMTRSNYVGSVGGMQIPSIIAFQEGFVHGAKYVNPNVQAVIPYTGNFYDAAAAKEMAISMIQSGADIIAHDADAAGLGVIEAGREYNIPTLGAIGDQQHLAPEVVVTSTLNDMAMAIFTVTEYIYKGDFKPVNYVMGIAEGCVDLAPFRHWEAKLDRAVIDRIMKIREDLKYHRITRSQF